MYFAFEGGEAAHFHLDGPFAVGKIGKKVGAPGISKNCNGLFTLASGDGRAGDGQCSQLDYAPMLPGAKKVRGE